MCHDLIFAASY